MKSAGNDDPAGRNYIAIWLGPILVVTYYFFLASFFEVNSQKVIYPTWWIIPKQSSLIWSYHPFAKGLKDIACLWIPLEVWHHMSSYHKTMQEVYFEFHKNGMWNHPSVQDWKKTSEMASPIGSHPAEKWLFTTNEAKAPFTRLQSSLMAPLGGLHVAASTKRQPTNGDGIFFPDRTGRSLSCWTFRFDVYKFPQQRFDEKSFPQKVSPKTMGRFTTWPSQKNRLKAASPVKP